MVKVRRRAVVLCSGKSLDHLNEADLTSDIIAVNHVIFHPLLKGKKVKFYMSDAGCPWFENLSRNVHHIKTEDLPDIENVIFNTNSICKTTWKNKKVNSVYINEYVKDWNLFTTGRMHTGAILSIVSLFLGYKSIKFIGQDFYLDTYNYYQTKFTQHGSPDISEILSRFDTAGELELFLKFTKELKGKVRVSCKKSSPLYDVLQRELRSYD